MALDKAALGERYTCFECEAKFYDLNRPEPTCPNCDANQRDRPSDQTAVAKPTPIPIPKPEELTKEAEGNQDEEELLANVDAIDPDEDDDMGLSELGAPEPEDETDEF